MKIPFGHTAAFCLSLVLATASNGQSRKPMAVPAEMPPAGFTGKQYVDSKGCVFVRAGSAALITWVPRMTRARKQICNAKPTVITAQNAPARRTEPPVQITLDNGPTQTAAAAAPTNRANTVRADTTSQIAATDPSSTPPQGFAPAWQDDRLNAQRPTAQKALRIQEKDLFWSQTNPPRLIDRNSGADVTARVALIYPYTSFSKQRRELGEVTIVTREGQRYKRLRRHSGTTVQRAAPAPVQPLVTAEKTATLTKPTTAQPPLRRYVQVASFGNISNANAAAQKLRRLGLPVRFGQLKQGSRTLRLVLSGPFNGQNDARRALSIVQTAGFNDAYIRK